MAFNKTCNKCKITYNAWHWFGLKNSDSCIFCTQFLPMRDERVTVLDSCRHYYLWSGETNEEKYNKIYMTYADEWCNHWSMANNDAADAIRQRLVAVTNWTREYWH